MKEFWVTWVVAVLFAVSVIALLWSGMDSFNKCLPKAAAMAIKYNVPAAEILELCRR